MKQIRYRGYNGQSIQHGKLTYEYGPLMLGSGVLDTAGIEIYEDDVVIYGQSMIGIVSFEEGEFVVMWDCGVPTGLHDLVTIVGNTHEQE